MADDSPRVKQLAALQERAESSPQARRVAQLQAVSQAGTAQRVFRYASNDVTSPDDAVKLGEQLYKELHDQFVKTGQQSKLSKAELISAVKELAVSGNHGELGNDYFSRLMEEGLFPESFEFQVKKRRVHTLNEARANFPPQRSIFQKHLGQDKVKRDLSYEDLRGILEGVLKKGLSQQEIDGAIREGIQKFDPAGTEIELSPVHDTDLQLIPQHLLRYQSQNRGKLKDTPKNKDENAFRQLVMELSRFMISRASSRLDRIVPPTADTKKGGTLYDALPALIDVNRPLANSAFGNETYKAVYLITYDLLRKAWDSMRAKQSKGTVEEDIKGMRSHMNSSFFGLIPEMKDSTVRPGKGQEYVTEHLKLPYDEDQESFDEGSSSGDDSSESETDVEMYDAGDPLDWASQKRKTVLNTLGTFVKMESQKELIDQDTEDNRRKFRRLRKGIRKRTLKIDKKYRKRYDRIAKESEYYKKKLDLIEKRREALQNEKSILRKIRRSEQISDAKARLKAIPKSSPFYAEAHGFLSKNKQRANTSDFKANLAGWIESLKENDSRLKRRTKKLKRGLERLEKLEGNLHEFYSTTSVGEILDDMETDPRSWRRSHPDVFGGLGKTALASVEDSD